MADRSHQGRNWKIVLAVAAFITTVIASLFPLVGAAYEGRLERDAARTPVELVDATDAQKQQAVAWWTWRATNIDLQSVHVLWFDVRDPSAPPPPGVPAWPGPGEVFASPALLAHSGGASFVSQYGELAGEIDTAALADPGERLVYVGVDESKLSPPYYWNAITRFGVSRYPNVDQGFIGTTLYQQPRTVFWAGMVFFGVAPVIVMVGVVARLGGERRDQRIAWLNALGARTWQWRRMLIRETWLPLLLGSAAATVLLGMATAFTWFVPGARFWIVSADMRLAWPALAALSVLTPVGLQFAIISAHRLRPRAHLGARPVPAPRKPWSWMVVVLLACVALTNYGYALLYPTNPSLAVLVSLFGGALAMVLLAPASGSALAGVAAWLRRRGRLRDRPVALLVGRELAMLPRPALRTAVMAGLVIVLAVQAQLLMSQSDALLVRGVQAFNANEDITLQVPLTEDRQWLAPFADSLPAGVSALLVERGEADTDTASLITGSCAALSKLFSACPAVPTPASKLWASRTPVQLRLAGIAGDTYVAAEPIDSETESTELLLVSTDGRPLSKTNLTRLLGSYINPVPSVNAPGETWAVGMTTGRDQARWIGTGANVALIIALATAASAQAFEVSRVGRRMASIAMLTSDRRDFIALGVGLLATPLLVAVGLGILVAAALVYAPSTMPGSVIAFPIASLVGLATLGAVVAYAVGDLGGRSLERTAHSWVPSADED